VWDNERKMPTLSLRIFEASRVACGLPNLPQGTLSWRLLDPSRWCGQLSRIPGRACRTGCFFPASCLSLRCSLCSMIFFGLSPYSPNLSARYR